jgi:hypothetical protein
MDFLTDWSKVASHYVGVSDCNAAGSRCATNANYAEGTQDKIVRLSQTVLDSARHAGREAQVERMKVTTNNG